MTAPMKENPASLEQRPDAIQGGAATYATPTDSDGTDSPPRPLCGTTRSSKEVPGCKTGMRADPARADTPGGLYDASTYHAWGLAQAVVSAAIRDGADPDTTAVRLVRRMAETFAADLAVFLRKQMDYGSGNISAFGVPGVLVRSHDKVERLRTLLAVADRAGAAIRAAVKGEAVDDTLADLTNYGAIGRLVLQGRWPEFEEARCPAP